MKERPEKGGRLKALLWEERSMVDEMRAFYSQQFYCGTSKEPISSIYMDHRSYYGVNVVTLFRSSKAKYLMSLCVTM